VVEAPELELLPLAVGLFGGLGLFLFGLELMTTALKAVAGDGLRTLLARLTVNPLTGVATGALVTAVIQSSSVTTVLVVSFISSGLMSLSQSVGVILGANIGTTVTAQIVAFKVTKLALAMVAAGFGLTVIARRQSLRHHGSGILGLGLVFLGMTVMGEAVVPLRDYPPFLASMIRMEHPLLGILAGAAFTALIQSSSATSGVVIAMASQGLITLPAGIALILGANVGTCITVMFASIGKPREAVRAGVVHVLFNLIGVLLWLGFIPQLAQWVTTLSPSLPGLAGADRLAAETPRQIANAHTLFNLVNALVFLPFASLLARSVEMLVPDRPVAQEELIRARYLERGFLSTPALALQQARREIARLGEHVERMLAAILPAMLVGSRASLDAVEQMDQPIDQLYDHIVEYLGEISALKLSDESTAELMHLIGVANSVESVGDVVETDLASRGRHRLDRQVQISPQTRKLIEDFHSMSAQALHDALVAVRERDLELARRVVAMKPAIQKLADGATRHVVDRLRADESRRLPSFAVETDMIEDLRRIFYFAKRIAHSVIDFDENGD